MNYLDVRLFRAAVSNSSFNRSRARENMHDDENGNDNKPPQNMSEPDMLADFMYLMSQEGISYKKLRKILAYVESVLSEAD